MIDFDRVTARGLVKVWGATRALAGVDLELPSSTVTVLEGPNGSGKSTLLAILALAARPTQGELRYGTHAASGALRSAIGVLAHAPMVYPDLTGRENLTLFARLHGLADPEKHVAGLCARFEIGAYGDRPTRTCSRGQLQRISLARALLHAPRLLLLDEPSTGLDAASVERLATAVSEERARGAIVLLVTHDPALASRLGDRTVRLDRGRVVPAARAPVTPDAAEAT